MELHGFVNIDKPLGWTSHDIVGRLRRILGTRKIGHAGTLDPAATGVLIAGVGRATRFLDYVQYESKSYLAHVVLGVGSESSDIDGRVLTRSETAHADNPPSRADIELILPEFIGDIDQVPPKYSAIKQDGEPIYRKMRRGEDVDVPVRQVRVDAIEVLEYSPPDLVLAVDCGSGVYIRSLARDIAEQLGNEGYLHHLVRTRVGQFDLSSTFDIHALCEMEFPQSWTSVATAIDIGIGHLPAVVVNGDDRIAWYHGRSIHVRSGSAGEMGEPVRVLAGDGSFVGLATPENSGAAGIVLRPRIVVPQH